MYRSIGSKRAYVSRMIVSDYLGHLQHQRRNKCVWGMGRGWCMGLQYPQLNKTRHSANTVSYWFSAKPWYQSDPAGLCMLKRGTPTYISTF